MIWRNPQNKKVGPREGTGANSIEQFRQYNRTRVLLSNEGW